MSDAVHRSFSAVLRFDADADRVFEVFCPVRERIDGELVHSASGGAEEGMVFRVPGREGASDTVYTYALHDPEARRIRIVGVRADDRVTTMAIDVEEDPSSAGSTLARVTLGRTGLSPEGSTRIARWTEADFREEMARWQRDLGGLLERGDR